MAKPEWGTKRSCPKCGTRFYDLGKDSPVVCIDCAHEWKPEPVLKSKQPVAEAVHKAAPEVKEDKDDVVVDEGLKVEADDADDAEDVAVDDDGDSDVSDVVTPPLDDSED